MVKSAPRQRRLRLACTHLRVRCRPRRVAARAKNGLRRRSSVTSFSERSLNQRIAELAGLPAPLTQVPRVRAMGEQSAEDERQTIDELRRRLDSFFDDTRALLSSLESLGVPNGSFPHPVFGPLTVTEWIAFHRLHSIDHIRQIDAVKSAPGYPAA